jgi:zinc transporter ZupT
MAVASLLTLLALVGVWAGVFLGRDTARVSEHLAAAGGGLLFGIALFWLVPEIGQTSGWVAAVFFASGVAAALTLLDRILTHTGHSARHGVVWPLLVATAIHSVLDGWSVRLLGFQPLDNMAVALGLALHKIPEGAAVGWIAHRAMESPRRAFVASAAAELFTLAGAFAEPTLNATGSSRFGVWWTPAVLSVIAGAFFFLSVHAIAPAWKRGDVMAIFLVTLLLVGALTFVRAGTI